VKQVGKSALDLINWAHMVISLCSASNGLYTAHVTAQWSTPSNDVYMVALEMAIITHILHIYLIIMGPGTNLINLRSAWKLYTNMSARTVGGLD
jgi:hypothetical protein